MIQKIKHYIYAIIITVILVIFDQFTKYLAVANLAGNDGFVLIKGVLEFQYLENTGAAFSILEGKMFVFYIVTIIIGGLVIYFMLHMPKHGRFLILFYSFSVLLAGALGNLIDRIMNHYVIDFIYFSLIHFPVFNVADIYVTCSVFFVMIMILFYYTDEELKQVL